VVDVIRDLKARTLNAKYGKVLMIDEDTFRPPSMENHKKTKLLWLGINLINRRFIALM